MQSLSLPHNFGLIETKVWGGDFLTFHIYIGHNDYSSYGRLLVYLSFRCSQLERSVGEPSPRKGMPRPSLTEGEVTGVITSKSATGNHGGHSQIAVTTSAVWNDHWRCVLWSSPAAGQSSKRYHRQHLDFFLVSRLLSIISRNDRIPPDKSPS